MTCDDFGDLVPVAAKFGATGTELAAMARHLGECSPCRVRAAAVAAGVPRSGRDYRLVRAYVRGRLGERAGDPEVAE